MSSYRSITAITHQTLKPFLPPGALAFDATAGRGHDTAFLAHTVGPTGQVWALDRQGEALFATRQTLQAGAAPDVVKLRLGHHEDLVMTFPEIAPSSLHAALFNLGYLPGGDPAVTTEAPSTLAALDQVSLWLRPDGILAVVCYPGHPAGKIEAAAVDAWFEARRKSSIDGVHCLTVGPTRRPAPYLWTWVPAK